MEIREGAYYRTREGRVIGPMRHSDYSENYPWTDGNAEWGEDGTYRKNGYTNAFNDLISEVYVSDTPPAVKEGENVSSKELTDVPTKALERFERLASTMVSAEYANGYREACWHIIHDTPPANAPAPETKTLRDEFAMEAMKILIPRQEQKDETFAELAYIQADAMMEARKK
jgi:hypothetical protein